MHQYLDLVKHILTNGVKKEDRTGTGTLSVFGYQTRYNLEEGFPLITTKKLHTRSIIHELLWFLKGETNIKYLTDNNVHIWDEWADKNGDLGPIYGKQWRAWPTSDGKTIDQITEVINSIKNNPDSRRHIVNSYNVGELNKMALPPCHSFFQFYVVNNKLSCQLYQRSCDTFLGCPYNIASYALLTHMIAQVCDLGVGEFIHTMGDAHIYLNHIRQCNEQLMRIPNELPQLELNKNIKNIFDFTIDDIKIVNYKAHPHIKGDVAV